MILQVLKRSRFVLLITLLILINETRHKVQYHCMFYESYITTVLEQFLDFKRSGFVKFLTSKHLQWLPGHHPQQQLVGLNRASDLIVSIKVVGLESDTCIATLQDKKMVALNVLSAIYWPIKPDTKRTLVEVNQLKH